MQKLTSELVAGLSSDGRDRIVFDAQVAGFGVRITPTGRKIFIAQGRQGNRPIRVTLGYADDTTVADARRDAVVVLGEIAKGMDPRQGRKVPGKRRTGEVTVKDFAPTFLEEHAEKLKPRTAADYKVIVENKLVPKFGNRPVATVSRAELSAWHTGMANTPRRANYVLAVTRKFFSFAEAHGKRAPGTNPAKGIKLFRERSVERFLSEDEIGKVATAISESEAAGEIGPHAAAGLRLAMLTGARRGEITAMRWEWIDEGRRLAVLPDSKTGKRVIHLSSAAMEVLKAVPRVGPYVIAGADPNEPYADLGRPWSKVRKRAGLPDVRLHDLRHTFASMAAAKGLSLPMIGKLLGHTVPATTQRYAHLALDPISDLNEGIGEALTNAMKPANEAASKSKKAKVST